jgi:hypothetical protein
VTIRSRRVDRDVLQTPVTFYRHPGTGRRITLISTVPVGSGDYYTGLADLITELTDAGAIVHSERPMLYRLEDLVDHTVSNQETDIIDLMIEEEELVQAGAALLGWRRQVDDLPVQDDWQLHDLTVVQIIRLVGATRLHELVLRRRDELGATVGVGADAGLQAAVGIFWRMAAMPATAGRHWPGDDVLVGQRTQSALAAAAGTDRDIVLLWGIRHLPGLDAGIRGLGFTQTGSQYRSVLTLPPLPDGESIVGLMARLQSRDPLAGTAAPTGDLSAAGEPAAEDGITEEAMQAALADMINQLGLRPGHPAVADNQPGVTN